jgi:hypothetical protein
MSKCTAAIIDRDSYRPSNEEDCLVNWHHVIWWLYSITYSTNTAWRFYIHFRPDTCQNISYTSRTILLYLIALISLLYNMNTNTKWTCTNFLNMYNFIYNLYLFKVLEVLHPPAARIRVNGKENLSMFLHLTRRYFKQLAAIICSGEFWLTAILNSGQRRLSALLTAERFFVVFWIKGTAARDFQYIVCSSNEPTWAPDSYHKIFSKPPC